MQITPSLSQTSGSKQQCMLAVMRRSQPAACSYCRQLASPCAVAHTCQPSGTASCVRQLSLTCREHRDRLTASLYLGAVRGLFPLTLKALQQRGTCEWWSTQCALVRMRRSGSRKPLPVLLNCRLRCHGRL